MLANTPNTEDDASVEEERPEIPDDRSGLVRSLWNLPAKQKWILLTAVLALVSAGFGLNRWRSSIVIERIHLEQQEAELRNQRTLSDNEQKTRKAQAELIELRRRFEKREPINNSQGPVQAGSKKVVDESQNNLGKDAPEADTFLVDTHYDPSGIMGDIGDVSVSRDASGIVRFEYSTKGEGPHEWDGKYVNGKENLESAKFAGVIWLSPPNAWGDAPNGGFDLREFRNSVAWEARCVGESVKIEFLIGGVNWKWGKDESGTWEKKPAPYPDSMPKISLGIRKLRETWQTFEFPLDKYPEEDFERVVGAFGWVASWGSNGISASEEPAKQKDLIFEVRNIRFVKATKQ